MMEIYRATLSLLREDQEILRYLSIHPAVLDTAIYYLV